MFENLRESLRTFSFQTVLKGNILSSPGSFGTNSVLGVNGAKTNSPSSNMVSNKYMSTYYSKMREIKDYEVNDLTNSIVNIYIDFINSYFNKDVDLVTVNDNVASKSEVEGIINPVLTTDLDIVQEVKDHLWDIIFEGSYCFRKEWDPSTQKYVKRYLQNPHNVVTVKKNRKVNSHLVVSKLGKIFEVQPDSIVRLGKADLSLINDINPEYYSTHKDDEDTLVKDDEMVAGTPLYYNIAQKVKEYLLKEQILSLLSIKDLIQPLLLLIRMDKNTSIDEGNRLALNVENMINKYSDISSIIGSNFSINSLIDSLMNNIRVIPDYHSAVGDMNNIDLSKITNKIQEIESSQDNKKEGIMNSASIPRALYNGESTKWDAVKSSQKLNNRIQSYVNGISDSIKLEAINIYYERTGKWLDPSILTVNLFKKTEVDYTQAITNTEIIGQIVDGVQRVLVGAQQTITEVRIIDPEKFGKYVSTQLKEVDPTISDFINDDTIKNGIAAMSKQSE